MKNRTPELKYWNAALSMFAVLLTEAPAWETIGLEMMLSMTGPKTMRSI